MSEQHDVAGLESLPLDVELIEDSTETVLAMQMATSTRPSLDSKTPVVVGHLQLLLGEELGADEDPEVRDLIVRSYRLLDLAARPREESPAFNVFFYNRDVALLTRKLLWVYQERREAGGA
ncbi:hypothetical protein [Streptomyces cavernicola]|uniref:Uncharacterized protein n=1 Tax=Streptomyces cavernicola TaxID=3043613 RepID=A0ABT6S3B3_9ACTN|nr:hypothetical protein [Streptomyces sp. B-S-A6]MDI3402589.1 hypothetical protein [Streptomyces sp. B-S-A6]